MLERYPRQDDRCESSNSASLAVESEYRRTTSLYKPQKQDLRSGRNVRKPSFQHQRRKAMLTATQTAPVAKTAVWAGRIMSVLAVVFLAFDSIIKVLNLAPAVEATTQLGYPASLVIGIGIIELLCLAVYALPRAS